jgi:hypothetical protein
MDGRGKTKIWRGGLAEQAADALQRAEQAGDAPAAAEPASAVPSASAPPEARPSAVPNAWSSGMRIGFASPLAADQPRPSSWQAVTRVVPIERVFAKAAPNAPASAGKPGAAVPPAAALTGGSAGPAAAPPAPGRPTSRSVYGVADEDAFPPFTPVGRLRARVAIVARALRGTRAGAVAAAAAKTTAERAPVSAALVSPKRASARVGRERLIMYGGVLALIAALAAVRAVRAANKAGATLPAHATTAEAAKPAISPRTAATAQATTTALAATPAPAAPVGNLPRAATDALARGDYAAAQRIYAELARSVPSPSPYSEAARILAQADETMPDAIH